jgi:uncharacterized protein (TIGR03435 family)
VTYLFAWPLLAGIAAFALLMTAPLRIAIGWRLAAMLVCPAPVFVLLVPLLSILIVALGARGASPLLGLAGLLMAICVSPQLVLAMRRSVAAGTPHVTRAIAGACLCLCIACASFAQTADAPPAFEVASVKVAARGEPRDVLNAVIPLGMRGGPGSSDPGQISFTSASLKTIVASAYGVKRYQVSGPDWLEAGGYNIVAKLPPNTTKEQLRLMLQNLLAERFALTLHHEKRELPVYTLVVAKNGPNMKVSEGDPEAGGTWGAWNGSARWVTPHTTMNDVADFLSPRLDRPVIDRTGLTAKYDLTLYWSAENLDIGLRTATARNTGTEAAEPAPTIFGAVQQLGLKLERSTNPTDILVIDHAEKTPSEN